MNRELLKQNFENHGLNVKLQINSISIEFIDLLIDISINVLSEKGLLK